MVVSHVFLEDVAVVEGHRAVRAEEDEPALAVLSADVDPQFQLGLELSLALGAVQQDLRRVLGLDVQHEPGAAVILLLALSTLKHQGPFDLGAVLALPRTFCFLPILPVFLLLDLLLRHFAVLGDFVQHQSLLAAIDLLAVRAREHARGGLILRGWQSVLRFLLVGQGRLILCVELTMLGDLVQHEALFAAVLLLALGAFKPEHGGLLAGRHLFLPLLIFLFRDEVATFGRLAALELDVLLKTHHGVELLLAARAL